jgi:hypothetical protein
MQRLFLACTPRTGNTWFRKMLAASLRFHETAAHSPQEIAWSTLPPECIVAMHWHFSDEFARFLRHRKFFPIVIVRHPLDVLISILQFAKGEPATARWLGGEGGDERLLADADPTSPEFLEYALSARAALLLGISAEWTRHAVSVVRYERLVEQPAHVLGAVLDRMGRAPVVPSAEVVAGFALERLKRISKNHFWRGEAGLWRKLLTREIREEIFRRHGGLFHSLGYHCECPTAPTAEIARETWHRLCESASYAGAGVPNSARSILIATDERNSGATYVDNA